MKKIQCMSLCVPMGLSKSKCVHSIYILWPIQRHIFKFELTLGKTKKHSIFPILLVLFFLQWIICFLLSILSKISWWHTVQYILMFNISGCFSLQHQMLPEIWNMTHPVKLDKMCHNPKALLWNLKTPFLHYFTIFCCSYIHSSKHCFNWKEGIKTMWKSLH